MSKSRVVERYSRSTEYLCDWLVAEHPALSPTELRDLALVIEDLSAQTKKERPSQEFVQRFGGRTRRGRDAKASDDEVLLVRDVIKQIEVQTVLTKDLRNWLLASHAKRLGYQSAKELMQRISIAESREHK